MFIKKACEKWTYGFLFHLSHAFCFELSIYNIYQYNIYKILDSNN